jgi:hypothetical protein
MRIKQELKPEATSRTVVRADLGYRGEVNIRSCGEVPDVHYSKRFGRERAFRFHVCQVAFPDIDMSQAGNLLERGLQARCQQWHWLTAVQLRQPPVTVSPTLEAVRATVWPVPKKLQHWH